MNGIVYRTGSLSHLKYGMRKLSDIIGHRPISLPLKL